MSRTKMALLFILVIFIIIQFIQPVRNQSLKIYASDISRAYQVPENVQILLKNSCYDCHSNNTLYPWYTSLQPAGWWLASHIKEGKKELNFNEFSNYSSRRQQSKLKAIASSIKDETMPLPAYLLMHKSAELSEPDKELLLNWIEIIQDSVRNKKSMKI